jgi:hypothetical protein
MCLGNECNGTIKMVCSIAFSFLFQRNSIKKIRMGYLPGYEEETLLKALNVTPGVKSIKHFSLSFVFFDKLSYNAYQQTSIKRL